MREGDILTKTRRSWSEHQRSYPVEEKCWSWCWEKKEIDCSSIYSNPFNIPSQCDVKNKAARTFLRTCAVSHQVASSLVRPTIVPIVFPHPLFLCPDVYKGKHEQRAAQAKEHPVVSSPDMRVCRCLRSVRSSCYTYSWSGLLDTTNEKRSGLETWDRFSFYIEKIRSKTHVPQCECPIPLLPSSEGDDIFSGFWLIYVTRS